LFTSELNFISNSEDQTRLMATEMGKLSKAGYVIALIGDLGTGKTRWAQGFGYGLGVPTEMVINSPTFTFINEYHGRLPFYHIDVYRLEQAIEAETLGLDDFLYGGGVCVIEWANHITAYLPSERLEIMFNYLETTRRAITMRAYGDEYSRFLKECQIQHSVL